MNNLLALRPETKTAIFSSKITREPDTVELAQRQSASNPIRDRTTKLAEIVRFDPSPFRGNKELIQDYATAQNTALFMIGFDPKITEFLTTTKPKITVTAIPSIKDLPNYLRSTGNYSENDIKKIEAQIRNTPKNATLDGLTISYLNNNKVEYRIFIAGSAYQDRTTLAATLSHELTHVQLISQGKDSEYSAYTSNIQSIRNMISGLSKQSITTKDKREGEQEKVFVAGLNKALSNEYLGQKLYTRK